MPFFKVDYKLDHSGKGSVYIPAMNIHHAFQQAIYILSTDDTVGNYGRNFCLDKATQFSKGKPDAVPKEAQAQA